MSESKAAVADIEINLQQALAAAIEAARSAGRIIWEASQNMRTAAAAEAAATSLPSKDPLPEVEGGKNPLPPLNDPHPIPFETKAAYNDLVTEYDRRCDAVILDALQHFNRGVLAEHPDRAIRFITEELNPNEALTDDLTWVVDPIDGTMSFVHGLPDCCVSIGLAWRRAPVLAVVFCPFLVTGHVGVEQAAELRRHFEAATRPKSPPPPKAPSARPTPAPRGGLPECVGELFTAIKGQGCFLNGVRVHVNAAAAPRTAMAVVNLPPSVRLSADEANAPAAQRAAIQQAKQADAIDAVLAIRGRAARDHLPGVRAYCSSVVTLAQIAAGRVDACVEAGSKIWDVCAGALLVTEAGGVVKNLYGLPFDMARDTSIAAGANETMVNYFTELCKEHSLGKYWLIE